MSVHLKTFEGKLTAIGDRVIVSDMFFGEQKTKGGIILTTDDGNVRGIYPRWGKVYSKGPKNKDIYNVGDWVLVEHGRWTRGVSIKDGEEELELRMIETESILAWSEEKPNDVQMGKSSVGDFSPDKISADEFAK
jgi:co-chaperonin GroES (HSP10)